MTDKINVYNRIVGEDNSECLKFKEILDRHFEKYRYFCSLLEDIGEDAFAEYECVKQTFSSMIIRVLPSSNERLLDLRDDMISITKKKSYSKYFKYNITSDDTYINIKISSKMKESDYYKIIRDCL